MERVTFLGLSHSCICIASEIIYRNQGIKDFEIIKNIRDCGDESLLKNDLFSYKKLWHEDSDKDNLNNRLFVFGCSGSFIKPRIYNFFNNKYLVTSDKYANLIHPSAELSKLTTFDNGILIEPLVVISVSTKLDFGVTVKRCSSIGHHCHLQRFVTINPGVTICGGAKIGKNTTIGAGTTVLDGIQIGENTIIGAGSVVTKDIPNNVIAYGSPCRIKKSNSS
jgi:sugar O-acyltransferase (sialic acid O-acetyltransferase NeuD family)